MADGIGIWLQAFWRLAGGWQCGYGFSRRLHGGYQRIASQPGIRLAKAYRLGGWRTALAMAAAENSKIIGGFNAS